MNSRPSGQDNGEPLPADVSLERHFFRWRTYVSFAIALAIIALVLTRVNIDFGVTWQLLGRTNLPLYVAALLVYYATFPLRALRWQRMLVGAGYAVAQLPRLPGLSEIIFLSWFANCLVPAKLGDLYRAYLLKKNTGLSFSKSTGTVLGERLVDFATLLAMMTVAGLVTFHGRLPGSVLAVLVGSMGLVLVATVGLVAMRGLNPQVLRLVPARFQPVYGRFSEGTLGSLRQMPAVVLLSGAAWLLESGRFFLVTRALGICLAADPWAELAVVVFMGLAAALLTVPPGTPAGLGYAEAGLTGALILYGASTEAAVSVTLLDRSLSYGSIVVLGALLYLVSKKK